MQRKFCSMLTTNNHIISLQKLTEHIVPQKSNVNNELSRPFHHKIKAAKSDASFLELYSNISKYKNSLSNFQSTNMTSTVERRSQQAAVAQGHEGLSYAVEENASFIDVPPHTMQAVRTASVGQVAEVNTSNFQSMGKRRNNRRTQRSVRSDTHRVAGRAKCASRERSRVEELRKGFQELQAMLPTVPRDTKLAKVSLGFDDVTLAF